MIIKYANTIDDFTELMAAYTQHSRRMKKRILIRLIPFFLLLLVLVLIKGVASLGIIIPAIIILLIMFALACCPFMYQWQLRWERRWGDSTRPEGPHELEVTEEGICETTGSREEKFKWNAFECYIITDTYVFIYRDYQHGLAILRSALTDDQLDMLRIFLCKYLKCEHEEKK